MSILSSATSSSPSGSIDEVVASLSSATSSVDTVGTEIEGIRGHSIDEIGVDVTGGREIDEVTVDVRNSREPRRIESESDGEEDSEDEIEGGDREEIKRGFSLWYSGDSGSIYHRQLSEKEKNDLVKLFIKLRQKIDPLAQDFQVHHDKQVITYKDSSGNPILVDCLTLSSASTKAALEAYLDKIDELTHFKRKSELFLSANSKGNAGGENPLQKPTKMHSIYGSDIVQFSPGTLSRFMANETEGDFQSKRLEMMDRTAYVYLCREKTKEILLKTKEEVEANLTTIRNATDRVARKKASELEKDQIVLTNLIKEIEALDLMALSSALALYPMHENDPELLKEAAEQVYVNLSKKFQTLKFKGHEEMHLNRYIQDISGLMFVNRWDYFDFCTEKGIEMKKETIEDVFMREAIACFKGMPVMNGLKSHLLSKTLSEETRALLQDNFDSSFEESKDILDSLQQMDERADLFTFDQEIPQDATKEQVNQIVIQSLKATQTDVQTYMQKVEELTQEAESEVEESEAEEI